ncbi:MAG: DUF1080 domain-containing protein, partial [Gimesia sp.]|nr:DUF1080 domain-containing protein [Gimesia sp.]
MKPFPLFTLCLTLFVGSQFSYADSKSPKWAATNVEEAGPDFQIQGEYSGTLGEGSDTLKYGVQVIALGKGAFRAVGYPEGLPGDGWNQEKKVSAEGIKTDNVISFKSEDGRGDLEEGKITIFDAEGNQVGVLEKVQRKSPTLGKKAPENATILFDSNDAEKTVQNFINGALTKDKLLKEGVTSKQNFKHGHLHLEFQLPFMPQARGQGRS